MNSIMAQLFFLHASIQLLETSESKLLILTLDCENNFKMRLSMLCKLSCMGNKLCPTASYFPCQSALYTENLKKKEEKKCITVCRIDFYCYNFT